MVDALEVKKLKTWSYFDRKGKRRKPSEYEVVSVNLHTRMDNPEVPFELDPDIFMNKWYRKNMHGCPLKHKDWDDFRDPDELIYRTYNTLQDGQEQYVDGLLNEYDQLEHDAGLSDEWLSVLARLYTPGRYLTHAVQMSSAYLISIAPASTISNCAIFQDGDSLRWLHRNAYRTAELAKHCPGKGFGENEREIWEEDEAWQGFRELMERQLVAYDWGEAFTSLNLVVKLAIDEACLRQLAKTARRENDMLLAMLIDAQLNDSNRHRRWTSALVEFALQTDANKAVLDGWLETWVPRSEAAIDAWCAALPDSPDAARDAKAAARAFRESAGLLA